MNDLLRGLILVPFIAAIIQWFKQMLPEGLYKFLWLLACGIWVLWAFGYVEAMQLTMNTSMIVMGGIVAWLSASGLYETLKNVKNSITD
jgi:hypothetical protein